MVTGWNKHNDLWCGMAEGRAGGDAKQGTSYTRTCTHCWRAESAHAKLEARITLRYVHRGLAIPVKSSDSLDWSQLKHEKKVDA